MRDQPAATSSSPGLRQVTPAPPTVSICTITCNRRQLLPLLQNCLLAQDYPLSLLQWILVDDSSVGEAPDLEPARDAGITVIWRELSERLPIGAKRNLANELTDGAVIVVMDDDDYYPPTRISHAVERLLATGECMAGCDRLPLLLLPEESRWLTPPYSDRIATANSLAYRRCVLENGHRFDPNAEKSEEPAFLAGPAGLLTPLVQLDPIRTLVCIGHGGNTVDKRTWMAQQAGQGFERWPREWMQIPDTDWLQRYRAALGLSACGPKAERQVDQNPSPLASERWRIAVVTPYHDEPIAVIQRCHKSVKAQTLPCVHVLVADGPWREDVAGLEGRHITLGVGHADNGNTPRSIGALAAMNEGFTCIAFLDADNWFSPDHLERAIASQAEGDWEVVFSDRHIVFPNGQRLLTPPAEDLERSHVDTSCMVIFQPAFASLVLWAQMPRGYGPLCDRVMFSELMGRYRCGWSGCATLFFETWYAGHFLVAGTLPPLNAKVPECRPAADWAADAAAFRQRSLTPVYPGPAPVSPAKTAIELITIHGPACSGGTRLQWLLCQHLGYAGIPDNQFLWQFVARLGGDHRLRYSGAEIVAAFADDLPPHPLLKAYDGRAIHLEACLPAERSYTLMEAYFRLMQAWMPAGVPSLARKLGSVVLLDRSCTLGLAAEVLFSCMPLHRALLVLRDPLEVVAQTLEMRRRWPEAWSVPDPSPWACAEMVLQTLAGSLEAAPAGQLHLVTHGELRDHPQEALLGVAAFLGQGPNPLGATEPLPDAERLTGNPRYAEECDAMLAALPDQLVRDEPWKANAVAAGEAPWPTAPSTEDSWAPDADLVRALAPLRAGLCGPGVNAASEDRRIAEERSLDELVERVLHGLDRHGFHAAEQEG